MSNPTIIKKYGNRRLYDTDKSRYITLEELARKVQSGVDVRVIDAQSGEDLTQPTLTQIVIEGRGAARMLPVPFLTQLIRLGDDALAEFCGRYMSAALEMYIHARRGANAMAPYNPFAMMPFATTEALARMWASPYGSTPPTSGPPPAWPAPDFVGRPDPGQPYSAPPDASAPAQHSPPSAGEDVAQLRRELEELKRAIHDRDRTGASDGSKAKKPAKRTRKRARKRGDK